MELIPGVLAAGKAADASECRQAGRGRFQIGPRIGGLVIAPDTERIRRLHQRRDVVGETQITGGLLRMRQRSSADDVGNTSGLVERGKAAGRSGWERGIRGIRQRLLKAIEVVRT